MKNVMRKPSNTTSGLEPRALDSTPSQVKTSMSMIDYVPPQQKPNTDCISCPKEKILEMQYDMELHFRCVHIAKLIVIHDVNILMCR